MKHRLARMIRGQTGLLIRANLCFICGYSFLGIQTDISDSPRFDHAKYGISRVFTGRQSLVSAWEALLVRPDLLMGRYS